LKPDFAVFIDVAPEKVLKRLSRKKSIMEKLETQLKVREIYLRYVMNGELALINGDKSLEEVRNELAEVVLKFLETFEPT
jgi:thymidylate kinase